MINKRLLFLLIGMILAPWAAFSQSNIIYQTDFEDFASDAMPPGWTKVINGCTARVNFSETQAHNSSQSFGFIRAQNSNGLLCNVIALPYFEVEPGSVAISFWAKSEKNSTDCGSFDVGYITDITNSSTFVCLYTYNYVNFTSYTLVDNLNLSSMPLNARIAFRHRPNNLTYKWYIDDLTVSALPICCPTPTVALPELTEGNGTIATLSWTEEGTANAWTLQYSTDPDFNTNIHELHNGFTVNGNTITANLTGLTPEQTYYARVKSDCASCPSGASQWIRFGSFKPTNAVSLPTIYSGSSSNGSIPFNTNHLHHGSRSQFIIPAEKLNGLVDGEIAKLTFYASTIPQVIINNPTFRIYMKEVDYTSFESNTFVDWNTLTEVYNGGFTRNGAEWSFEFDESNRFTYQGGNLLIAFYQSAYNEYDTYINWLGVAQTDNTAVSQIADGAHGYDNTQIYFQQFLPKTTFTYFASNYPRPRNLTFTDPTTNSITASWTAPSSNVTKYQYQYSSNGGANWTSLTSTTATSVTLTNLSLPDHTYLFRVRALYGTTATDFASGEFTTEALCPIPQGIALDNITAHTATFSWNVVTGASYQGAVSLPGGQFQWGPIPTGNTFSGLNADTDYVFHLRRNCTASQYGYSDEATYAFHTELACPPPTNVEVSYNGGTTATVTWEGNAESYAISVNGVPVNGSVANSPYQLTVAYATSYTIGVKALCGSEGNSDFVYADSFLTDLCAPADQCAINYTLTDANGDSWGRLEFYRPHIRVEDHETHALIENLTLIEDVSASGSFDVCDGRALDFYWDTASINNYAFECGFIITDINGNVICQHTGGNNATSFPPQEPGLITTYTVSCALTNCARPTNFQASAVTTTATVSWTDNGIATSWKVSYKKATDSNYSAPVTVTTKSYSFSNLISGTTYDVLIVSGCDPNQTLEGSFTTECDAITISANNPFTEGFEGWIAANDTCQYNDVNGIYPDCWKSYSEGQVYPHIINYGNNCYYHQDTCAMYFKGETGTNSYLALPAFTNSPSKLLVSFWMQSDHASQGAFSLGYITEDDVNFDTYQLIETYPNSTSMVQCHTYLGQLPDEATRIVFRWTSGNSSLYGVCIDDVTVTIVNKIFTGSVNDKWNNASNWVPSGKPDLDANVFIQADVTITGHAQAKMIAVQSGKTLTIADGGTLKTDNELTATIKKNIAGFTSNLLNTNVGYNLIANPITETVYNHGTSVTPNISTTGLRSGTYDLYVWDYTENQAWRNYKEDRFNLVNGKGYLYANLDDVELTFTGTVKANNVDEEMTLSFDETTYSFNGWNLLGNPFVCNAYLNDASSNEIAFYRMNRWGNNFTVATGAIRPMEGVFVKATAPGQSFKFSRNQVEGNSRGKLNVVVGEDLQSTILDNAIVRFDEGAPLEKFSFQEGTTKVSIPMEGKDYAVVNAGEVGELPINFNASKDGSYTLSFTQEDVDFSYLHLIDNMTGADIDLLAQEQPYYTFQAKTTDYASRFKLVFATGSSDVSSTDTGTFAFINAMGNLMIFGVEGEATLQVIDILGHVVSSETFSGNYNHKIAAAPGLYLLRLISGNDVKVQKLVIK